MFNFIDANHNRNVKKDIKGSYIELKIVKYIGSKGKQE